MVVAGGKGVIGDVFVSQLFTRFNKERGTR